MNSACFLHNHQPKLP
ncbi:AgrD family cyclic lactone autoinducer peptide [Streptococcus infantarius]